MPKLLNGQLVPTHEVRRLGFQINICGATLLALYRPLASTLHELRTTGASTFDAITDLLGLPAVYETEARYGVSASAEG